MNFFWKIVISGAEHSMDLRPVCNLEFVHCGPEGKQQSTLFFLVESWRPDEVREHLFPNSEIGIFDDFRQNSQIFKKILREQVLKLGALYFGF